MGRPWQLLLRSLPGRRHLCYRSVLPDVRWARGITTIGANDISMGIVGAFTGFGTWVALRKFGVSIFWAAGMAGFIGDIFTYATTAFQLAVSLHPEALFRYWGIFLLGYVPTQLPIAIMEFVFTGLIIRYIAEVRPEMMRIGRAPIRPTIGE